MAMSVGLGLDLLVSGTWVVVIVRLLALSRQTRRDQGTSLFWLGMMATVTVTLRWTDWLDWQSAGWTINPVIFGLLFVSLKAVQALLSLQSLPTAAPAPDQESWFETFCHTAPVGFFFYHEAPERQSNPLFVNRYWQERTGYDAAAFQRVPWDWMLHPEDRAHVRQEWERCMALQQPFCDEFRWVGKDGQTIWVDLGAVPMPLTPKTNQKQGYAVVVRDITHEKEMQHDLARLREQQDELMQFVTHELRTPLTNIKLAVRMLSLNPSPDNLQKYLRILQSECDRELELVNNLLDYQQLQSAVFAPSIEWCDVSDWLQNLLAPFRPRWVDSGIDFQLQVAPSLQGASLLFDRSGMTRVVSELLNNACKYTPTGEMITVAMSYNKERFYLSVCNTGVVIPPDVLPRLFERFYRAPQPGRQQVGSGLGLTLVEALIKQMKGSITVTSTEQETRFAITLPVPRRQPSEVRGTA